MTALPKVVSPLVFLGEREGVELVLVSVEAWPDEVVVRMRGRPSATTVRMETDFHAALDRWHAAGRSGQPPDQPGDRALGFDVGVTDDLGTSYELLSSSRGGSGTMFRGDLTFIPGPPETARQLSIRIADVGQTEIDLASV